MWIFVGHKILRPDTRLEATEFDQNESATWEAKKSIRDVLQIIGLIWILNSIYTLVVTLTDSPEYKIYICYYIWILLIYNNN
jgi:hypothetical protein